MGYKEVMSECEWLPSSPSDGIVVIERGCASHLSQGRATSVHDQPAWKLVVAIEGAVLVRDRHGVESSGLAVLVPPNASHAIAATGTCIAVLVDPFTHGFASKVDAVPRPLEPGKVERRVIDAVRSLGAAMARPEVLVEIAREALVSLEVPKRHAGDARVRRVLEGLHADPLSHEHSLPTLARAAGLSEARLRHLFAEEMGLGLRTYKLWLRLSASLGQPPLTASATASSLAFHGGFADHAHFSRAFRRFIGRTPSDLRDRLVCLHSYVTLPPEAKRRPSHRSGPTNRISENL